MRVLVEGLPRKTLLNINVPGGAPRGIRFTRLGHRVYGGKVVEQADPRGRAHYWLGGGPPVATGQPWVNEAWRDRVSLAGSETAGFEPGYLAGAVDAAERAVADITGKAAAR